ncbi:MAG: hypothetical protein R3301_00925 [Saprospiraceae bacterium]|nr:hypothetical protein [Saprospiraceae bacterium]
MQSVLQQLEVIELKIKDLASKYAALKEEKEQLKRLNSELQNDLDQIREEKVRLEQALSSALSDAKAVKDRKAQQARMQKELGQYIKEIDKCIALMQET